MRSWFLSRRHLHWKDAQMCSTKLIPVKQFVLWQSFCITLRGETIYCIYVRGHQSTIIGLGGHTFAFVFKNDEMIPTQVICA